MRRTVVPRGSDDSDTFGGHKSSSGVGLELNGPNLSVTLDFSRVECNRVAAKRRLINRRRMIATTGYFTSTKSIGFPVIKIVQTLKPFVIGRPFNHRLNRSVVPMNPANMLHGTRANTKRDWLNGVPSTFNRSRRVTDHFSTPRLRDSAAMICYRAICADSCLSTAV